MSLTWQQKDTESASWISNTGPQDVRICWSNSLHIRSSVSLEDSIEMHPALPCPAFLCVFLVRDVRDCSCIADAFYCLNIPLSIIVTDNYLEHHLEKKSENRHGRDVLSMGFKKSS